MTDRTLKPDAAFLARFADMDDRPDAPESYAATVERMARAIEQSQAEHTGSGFPCPCGWLAGFGEGWERRLSEHRVLAAAAAAFRAEHEGGSVLAPLPPANECGCVSHPTERCGELECDCIAAYFAAYDPGQFDYDAEESR